MLGGLDGEDYTEDEEESAAAQAEPEGILGNKAENIYSSKTFLALRKSWEMVHDFSTL